MIEGNTGSHRTMHFSVQGDAQMNRVWRLSQEQILSLEVNHGL